MKSKRRRKKRERERARGKERERRKGSKGIHTLAEVRMCLTHFPVASILKIQQKNKSRCFSDLAVSSVSQNDCCLRNRQEKA